MKFLLDTDTCVYWLRGSRTVRDRVATVSPTEVAVSVVTVAELRYGASTSNRASANHGAIDGLIAGFAIVGVGPDVARRFGEEKAGLRARGELIEDFDLLIGATALTHGLMLVTNNTNHFRRVPNLRIENWIS